MNAAEAAELGRHQYCSSQQELCSYRLRSGLPDFTEGCDTNYFHELIDMELYNHGFHIL
jgi:hypothetical protein